MWVIIVIFILLIIVSVSNSNKTDNSNNVLTANSNKNYIDNSNKDGNNLSLEENSNGKWQIQYPQIKNSADALITEIQEKTVGTEATPDIYNGSGFELNNVEKEDNFLKLQYKFKNIELKLEYDIEDNSLYIIDIEYEKSAYSNIISNIDYLSIKMAIANLEILSLTKENFKSENDYDKYNGIIIGTGISSAVTGYKNESTMLIMDHYSSTGLSRGFWIIFKND